MAEFDILEGDFSKFYIVQTSYGAHPPSYPNGNEGVFPMGVAVLA
jgi:hypothetical protein